MFNLVGRLEATLDHYRDRHEVLAGNVANVDTPGFLVKDLKPLEDAFEGSADVDVVAVRTHPAHMSTQGPSGGGVSATELVEDRESGSGPDGNNVRLEREMAKLEANRVGYRTASALVARRLALLRYAAGDGS